ncbi:MAG: DPP IV N-terminal domain-containing protein [Bacteroidota bacterium]|nr:DPP IV N-terminal domain-containing protein [Bacteroidota bacterium]MDP4245364.1 DPP IV N-terminal domain-containing protein [Bacteroidota bacterium]
MKFKTSVIAFRQMRRVKTFSISVLTLLCSFRGICQAPVAKANYKLAALWKTIPYSLEAGGSVFVTWFKNTNRCWYEWPTEKGNKWYVVDAVKKTKSELFDTEKMAADISRIVKDPIDAQHLNLMIKNGKTENTISFEYKSTALEDAKPDPKDSSAKSKPAAKQNKTFYFEYNYVTRQLKEIKQPDKPKAAPSWACISPDSSVVVFARSYNLFYMSKADFYKALKDEKDSTIRENLLTRDGERYFSYSKEPRVRTNIEKESNDRQEVSDDFVWSPDSRHFALTRSDKRKVNDLWVVNNLANPRPVLDTYKYAMAGEKNVEQQSLVLGDIATGAVKTLNTGRFKDQRLELWQGVRVREPDKLFQKIWLGTSGQFYIARSSRDRKSVDVCLVSVETGNLQTLVEERSNTYIEQDKPVMLVNEGKEFILWSERDGWAHLYLYDGSGKLENQITSGSYHCELMRVDEKRRMIYFYAYGKEPNEDPYNKHLYRVNFDGSDLRLLTPGSGDHSPSIQYGYVRDTATENGNNKYFVDNCSSVTSPQEYVLRDIDGNLVMPLEKRDISRLLAAGYRIPEAFKVKAADNLTDLYGIMYKPFDFDSTKKYPIIEFVYPGPQTENIGESFKGDGSSFCIGLAQFGFIVIQVGNRGGNPYSSKYIHNYGYGNMRDYGLADKKAAIEQLAMRHSYIDIERVGITGCSGGGFMSATAMLVYPDFFKVGVCVAGNYDNSIYNNYFPEKYDGIQEEISATGDTTFHFSIDKTAELAKNLKGRMLLACGDVDRNVHPANTFRLADALIKANKRFDMFIKPGDDHGYLGDYFYWIMADYFCKYLLGDFSQPIDMDEMSLGRPQTKK